MKTETQKYIVAYKSDFVTDDQPTIHDDLKSAMIDLNYRDEADELTILRAPDGESDFDHCLENGEWVKYC